MKKQEILSVAIKIFGLYLLVMSIQMLPTIGMVLKSLFQMEEIEGVWYLVVTVIPILLTGAVALLFMISTPNIVKCVSDEEREEKNDGNESGAGISKETLQEVVFSGLGLFFAVNSLPRVITTLLMYRQGNVSGLVGAMIQLALGIYLFLCSGRVVEVLERFEGRKRGDGSAASK
jgi:hypothetical protein